MITLRLPKDLQETRDRVIACLARIPDAAVQQRVEASDLRFLDDDSAKSVIRLALAWTTPTLRIDVHSSHGHEIAWVACTNHSVSRNIDAAVEGLAAAAQMAFSRGGDADITIEIDADRSGRPRAALRNRIQKKLRGIMLFEQWQMGVASIARPEDLVALVRDRPLHWLRVSDDGTFTADPFIVHEGDRTFVVYEYLDTSGKGKIRCKILESGVELRDVPLLERDCHLSYPFILRHEGNVYVVPESSSCGDTVAYTFDLEKMILTPCHTLFSNVGVVDPTLVQHDGVWYLFGSIPGVAENAALWVWTADGPFGPWTPHARNPVKIDVASSRPAGQLIRRQNGMLIRPAQDSTSRYGSALALNEITALTPTTFSERTVETLRPNAAWGARRGLHHVSIDNGMLVLDALHDRISLFQIRSVLGL